MRCPDQRFEVPIQSKLASVLQWIRCGHKLRLGVNVDLFGFGSVNLSNGFLRM